jgi:hypothetical protein
MQPNPYTFRLYAQGRTERRAVGFIVGGEYDALTFFESLSGTPEREFRERFEAFLDGAEGTGYKKYFHGWDEPEFRECFEFKRQRERLVGFKCHPKPKSRLHMVVLLYYCDKEGWEFDKTLLRRVNRARVDAAITKAIKKIYPEYGE